MKGPSGVCSRNLWLVVGALNIARDITNTTSYKLKSCTELSVTKLKQKVWDLNFSEKFCRESNLTGYYALSIGGHSFSGRPFRKVGIIHQSTRNNIP